MFESPWMAVFGRLHLLVLHFPIALLLIGGLLEFFQFKGKQAGPRTSAAGVTCVVLGCLLAWLAGVTGWIYAARDLGEGLWESGFFDGDGLDWHRWTAVITAILCLPLLVLAIVSRSCHTGGVAGAYRVLLALSAIGVGLTGHFGGELIHGRNFLLAPLNQKATPAPGDPGAPAQDPGEVSGEESPQDESTSGERRDDGQGAEEQPEVERVSFSLVAEILSANCVRCHGPERDRGGIRLATLEEVHDVIDPGFPNDSLIVEVIRLPEDDPLHMPKNKPSLPEEDIRTIELWIKQLGEESEALPEPIDEGPIDERPAEEQTDEQATESPGPAPTAPQLPPEPSRTYTDAELQARDQAMLTLRERGAIARRISEQSQDIEVLVLESRAEFGDDDAQLLPPLADFIVRLDLTATGVTDAALERIGRLSRLRALRLGETAISDDGLDALTDLDRLERLDLHLTGVSANGVRPLLNLPSLRTLHLWETRVERTALGDIPAHLEITGLN